MAKVQKVSKEIKKTILSPFKEYWNKNNYMLLGLSLLGLVLGYFLMSRGPWDSFLSLSISPVVLTIIYLIMIPVTILFNKPTNKTKQ
jgi:hypothetical protein